jgi:hypothetical protein
VFSVNNGKLTEQFSFGVRGRAEAYFCGGYVFVSPLHGDASAYTLTGEFVRTLSENSYLAEVCELDSFIAASYVVSSSDRYSLLLKPGALETVALLPGFLGETLTGGLILDDGNGSLRAVTLLDTPALMDMARERLGDRALTPDEEKRFKAG